MNHLESCQVSDFLGASFQCSCGREHSTHFSNYIIERDAIKKLPGLLNKLGYHRPFVLADTHTYAVAGKQVEAALTDADIPYKLHVLKSPEVGDLAADEAAMGSVAMAFDVKCDILISVGTGTINDLGRYFTYICGRPFMLVATAPSMDGLVSGCAPLITNNLKITYDAHAPLALICDLDIMSQAPMKMLAAGVGDILGKYNCLCDWRPSSIINGEYYCETIAGIMRTAVEKTVESVDGLIKRDPEAVALLTEALTLSGIAMDFSGNSRPASGAEHHQSHFWEMQFLFDHKPAVLHGTKVGIGTVLMLALYDHLKTMEKPDFAAIKATIPNRPSKDEWKAEITRSYRLAADGIIALEEKAGKNDTEKLTARLDVIEEKWNDIQQMVAALPSAKEIYDILDKLGAPKCPPDVEIKKEYVRDSILYAKELRDRYTILQLMWDLGELPKLADKLADKYCGE